MCIQDGFNFISEPEVDVSDDPANLRAFTFGRLSGQIRNESRLSDWRFDLGHTLIVLGAAFEEDRALDPVAAVRVCP